MASRSDIQAGGAFVRLYVKDSEFSKGLKEASRLLTSFGKQVAMIGSVFVGLGTSISGVMFKAAKDFADAGDAINKMSQRTGVGTNALSELAYAAGQSGAEVAELEAGISKMQRAIAAAKPDSKLFDLKSLPPEEQLLALADRISAIQDPAERTAAVIEVFGKSGARLLPLFADGAAGIRLLMAEAKELGKSIDPKDAEAATQLGDAWDRLKSAFEGAVFSVGGSLAADLTKALEVVKRIVVETSDWIRENKAVAKAVAIIGAGAAVIGTAVTAVGVGIAALGMAVGSIPAGVAAIGGAFAAVFSPVGAILISVIGAVGLAAAAFWKLTDPIKALQPLVATVITAMKGIGTAIGQGNWAGAAQIAIDGVKAVILEGTAAMMRMITTALQRLPGLFTESMSGLGGITATAFGKVKAVFLEILPAAKVAFNAFLSFSKDVFSQLPAIAGYAIGRMVRAIVDAVLKLNKWLGDTFANMAKGLLENFSDFGPRLVKAMFTGDISAVAKEMTAGIMKTMQASVAAAGGLMAGIAGAEMPEFKVSSDTRAAIQQVADEAKRVQRAIGREYLGQFPRPAQREIPSRNIPNSAAGQRQFQQPQMWPQRQFQQPSPVAEVRKELSGLDSLPDNLKEIIEESKSPLQKHQDLVRKFNNDMTILRKAGLSQDHFKRAAGDLEKSLFGEVSKVALGDKALTAVSSAGTFGPGAAQTLGIGGVNDKQLNAQKEGNEHLRVIAEEVKKRPRFKA